MKHRQFSFIVAAAGKRMQIDDEADTVFPAEREHLFIMVEHVMEPRIVLRKIAVGAGLPPVPDQLGPDQIDVPIAERCEILRLEPDRRHHSAQRGRVSYGIGITRRVFFLRCGEKFHNPQGIQIEFYLAAALLQAEFQGRLVPRAADHRIKGELLPIKGTVNSHSILPLFPVVFIGKMEHEFNAVIVVSRFGYLPSSRTDGKYHQTLRIRLEINIGGCTVGAGLLPLRNADAQDRGAVQFLQFCSRTKFPFQRKGSRKNCCHEQQRRCKESCLHNCFSGLCWGRGGGQSRAAVPQK